MKKYIFISIFALFSCKNNAQPNVSAENDDYVYESEPVTTSNEKPMTTKSIYDFKVTDLAGAIFDFSTLKGKKILIVNTASKCGLTPQYKDLQKVYEQYKGNNFVVIGFPANNFGSQEPGTDQEIGSFCAKNYGVTFPMMSKISVKGNDMHEIYQFLTQKSQNGLQDSEVGWNFQKYLISADGKLEKVIAPNVAPTDDSIVNWIKA